MDVANTDEYNAKLERRRMLKRAAPLAVRVWTGRSALSSKTTTARPHIATAGARRTRVSGMRLIAPHHRERSSVG